MKVSVICYAKDPRLEHTIAWLRQYGVTQIGINLHHCHQVVTRYFGDGSEFGVDITYSVEDKLMGTAGGVKRLEWFLNSGAFVVVYGDVLTNLDLQALTDCHSQAGQEPHLTMALHRVLKPWEAGVVSLDVRGRVTTFVEKPARADLVSDLVNAGVMIVDPDVLEYVPDDSFCDFGYDIFPELIRQQVPMYGWVMPDSAYLVDVGTPESYQQAQHEWLTPIVEGVL